MNRRNFALRIAAGTGMLTFGSLLLAPAAAARGPGAAPGWSSARAAGELRGLRFSVDGIPGTALELTDVITYRGDDRQFTARFAVSGQTPCEGIHRLRAAGQRVDLFLQPVHGRVLEVEAAICHVSG